MRSVSCLLLLLLLTIGCHPLPAGDLRAVQQLSSTERPARIFLLRGWRDLHSAGMDELANELRAEGFIATVYRESQWQELAASIGSKPVAEPIVLIGFSFGADHAIDVARELHRSNIPVNLLITLDPVTPASVPGNVLVCHNFYQSNGVWDLFPWFRGIPLTADKNSRVQLTNTNVHDRPDLDDPNMAHSTIAGSPKVRRAVVERILKSFPRVQ